MAGVTGVRLVVMPLKPRQEFTNYIDLLPMTKLIGYDLGVANNGATNMDTDRLNRANTRANNGLTNDDNDDDDDTIIVENQNGELSNVFDAIIIGDPQKDGEGQRCDSNEQMDKQGNGESDKKI